MQQESALDRTFFQRTDQLAARWGVNIEELPRLLGISRRTLFECRSADSAVSARSWARLAEAEKKTEFPAKNAVSLTHPNDPEAGESAHSVRDELRTYRTQADEIEDLKSRVEKLEKILDCMRRALIET